MTTKELIKAEIDNRVVPFVNL